MRADTAAVHGVPHIDRILLAAAAPSWRARYAEEFGDLLRETRPGFARTAGVAGIVARSWLRPSKHLHNRRERLQATITTQLTLTMILFAVSTLYWFVSIDLVPGEAASAVTWAHTTRLFTVVTAVVLGSGVATLAGAALRRRAVLVAELIRPLIVSVGCVAAGTSIVALTPRLARFDLGPASWFVIPVALILAGALALGTAVHRALAANHLHPAGLAVALVASWSAVVFMGVATVDDLVMRGEGRHAGWNVNGSRTSYLLHSWYAWILLLLVVVAGVSVVSLGRAALALARRRPALD